MRFAYTVPGATSSAHTPVPAVTAAVLNYKGGVVGQPGTQGIPSGGGPGLAFEYGGGRYELRSGYSGGTGTMPGGAWYPNLYYQRTLEIPGAEVVTGGMSVFSDNQLPVPARDPRGRAAVLATPPRFLGQFQVKMPRAFPAWPNMSNWIPTPNFGG